MKTLCSSCSSNNDFIGNHHIIEFMSTVPLNISRKTKRNIVPEQNFSLKGLYA